VPSRGVATVSSWRRSSASFRTPAVAPECSTAAPRTSELRSTPRFTEGNFEKNLRIVDEVEAVASEVDATPAQVALAWLLAQGDDIAPIPGTKRVSRVEENTAADGIELSAEQIRRLNDLTPAAGERHDEANMSRVDR
jgi:aryl-alcohol dehydrogenase-like predicted oxidoreductase